MFRSFIVILATLLVAACATPGTVPHGSPIVVPSMTPDAFIMADATRLPLRVWQPSDANQADKPRAIIIGVHGMNDYSDAFAMPATYFAQHAIVTFAYDQRCFGKAPNRGKWAGTPTMISDLDTVTALVRARYPGTPIYLFGLSMGGAVILASAGEHRLPPVDGVILAAPAVWGWQAMNIAYKITLWTGAHIMPGKTVTGERLSIWPSDNIEMLRALARDPLEIKETKIGTIYGLVTLMDDGYKGASQLRAPTLLLYGKKDQIVPKEPVMTVAKHIPGPHRLIYYSDGYHMLERDLQAENVWRDIDTWVADHNAPMPSVARDKPAATELDLGGASGAAASPAHNDSVEGALPARN